MILEENVIRCESFENAGFAPLGPKFLTYLRRHNERVSWTMSNNKSRRTVPIAKNYKDYNVEIEEKMLIQLLFADIDKGPCAMMDFLSRIEDAAPKLNMKTFRRLADFFELTPDEINEILRPQNPNGLDDTYSESQDMNNISVDVKTAISNLGGLSKRSRRNNFGSWMQYVRSQRVEANDQELYIENEKGLLHIVKHDGGLRALGSNGTRYKLLPDYDIYC